MFKEYIKYLRDNPEGYWFKRKLYGYGWVPVTWQGWTTIAVFIALITLNALRLDLILYSPRYTFITFISETLVLVLILILICIKKGEKPRWQWGDKDKEEKDK